MLQNAHSPKGVYRAETPRRGGPESFFSATQPLRARFFPVLAANGSTPMRRRISPPQRQRRCAIEPGVVRVAALPRVLTTSGSLPHKGLCRSCPSGGCDIKGRNGIGFTGAEEESARNVCPLSTKYTHITYHTFEPSAQPRWGCLCLWPLPGVAPRRRNPGLHGRIPLGFPEGDGARHDLGDSRRGNGDEPSSGVSGWGNWSTSIPTVMIPLGFPEGDGARHGLGDSRRGTPGRWGQVPTLFVPVTTRDRTDLSSVGLGDLASSGVKVSPVSYSRPRSKSSSSSSPR